MTVYLNGEFVPEERALVSVFDRSFRYGDGLFETMLVVNGRIFRWEQHWARLSKSAQFLRLNLPASSGEIHTAALELLRQNCAREAVLRLQISRGDGERGYAPTGREVPRVVLTTHPAPPRPAPPWKLTVSPFRVDANDPFQGHKTTSRALQVMTAAHARDAGADEAVVMHTLNWVAGGGASNLFWIKDGSVRTVTLLRGVLPGITRAVVIELCRDLGLPHSEEFIHVEHLLDCEGVFLTQSTRGVIEADSLDGKPFHRSPLTRQLQEGLTALIARECGPA